MWEVLIYLCFILFPHEKVESSFQSLEGISLQAQLSDKAAVAGGSSVPTTQALFSDWRAKLITPELGQQ